MFKKILVPLDGSEIAERALELALTVAQQADGEIILLSVSQLKHINMMEPVGYSFDTLERPHPHSFQKLTAYQKNVQQGIPDYLSVKSVVAEGDAASVIVDTAVNQNIDLIIMSTHGRSGLSRWIMGSVTEKVLRHAPCPLLVLPDSAPLTNILITLDGSNLSEQALAPGVEIANLLGSHVTLLSVESLDEISPRLVAELEKAESGLGELTRVDYYHRTENYLQRTSQKVQPALNQKVQIAPRVGSVATAILDHIKSHNINLVVMATHGQTGLKRWVYGSITEKILRKADCAMLIVRPPEINLN